MLKPLALYMLVTVFNYLMILSAIFEKKVSAVRKEIMDDFVWRKGILFILKKFKIEFNVIVMQQYICFQWIPWHPLGWVSALFHASLENWYAWAIYVVGSDRIFWI